MPHSDHFVSIVRNTGSEDRLTQRCQCAYHEDSYNETVPETTKSDVLVDAAHRSSKCLSRLAVGVELADHDICWMRHNGTENTS